VNSFIKNEKTYIILNQNTENEVCYFNRIVSIKNLEYLQNQLHVKTTNRTILMFK